MVRITPHPKWVDDLVSDLQPYQESIRSTKIFEAVANDSLTKSLAQGAMSSFYPLIESFPQFLALNLTKVPPGTGEVNNSTRDWLIGNITQERLHAKWWRKMARRFGVSSETLNGKNAPPAQVDVLNNYLWRICTHGSLPEAIAAANFAVEGATGEWTKQVARSFERFPHCEEIELSDQDLEWISAHATYDDRHPVEALEIIKAYAVTEEDQRKSRQAAMRALEYYLLALTSCYELNK